MTIYTQRFPIQFDPIAREEAIVAGPNVRFTVLSPHLLRLEYSPDNTFEDRPSQPFWYRRQPVPDFTFSNAADSLEIETGALYLRYLRSDAGFKADTLAITLKESGETWRYGQPGDGNLLGTYRTLDNVEGSLTLEPGLLSQRGWSLVDDSHTLVFDEAGWIEPRNAPAGYQDLYFFGHGRDYTAALRDFFRLAGPIPLIPRWALGNWWSRYWAYTADELLDLMRQFQARQIPLSVCIVDMDWHITETGNESSGWTGYTWNRELFPDPAAFLAALHEMGLKTSLNLHPAEGIHPHEEQYEAMARRLGVDPATKQPIPFDIGDPRFAEAYFELLHHPMEEQGVDFWWMDWQQGTLSRLPGLDPLWWLNHLHFYDRLTRKQRGFVFSRWGGLGNHRYPIGFSGDTIVSWQSLAFQPYFTATAANVGYSWWSHDIGGHMGGVEDPELYTRWVQYGLFSPILRLHSTKNPFHERRPWGYDAETERITRQVMQLRHAFIPYLYTMAWRNHSEGIAPVRPMYHDYPGEEAAYQCHNQYLFGSELIAAPFIAPADPDTRLAQGLIWLPPGDWFHFFAGSRYPAGWHALYGERDEIPVFARAGAIVPLGPQSGWAGIDNPEALELHIFPGADNDFDLYEDGGRQAYSLTPFTQRWQGNEFTFSIEPVRGSTDHLSTSRSYTLLFRGLVADPTILALQNDRPLAVQAAYDPEMAALRLGPLSLAPTDRLTLTLAANNDGALIASRDDYRLEELRKLVHVFPLETNMKYQLDLRLAELLDEPSQLSDFELALGQSQMRALLEVITGAGFRQMHLPATGDEVILFWNNDEREDIRYKLLAQDLVRRPVSQKGPLPQFAVLTIGDERITFTSGDSAGRHFDTVDEWLNALPRLFQPAATTRALEAVIQCHINHTPRRLPGEGSGDGRSVYIHIRNKQLSVKAGVHEKPDLTLATDAASLLSLVNLEADPLQLFYNGSLSVAGQLQLAPQLLNALGFVEQNTFQAGRWQLTITYLDLLQWTSP